MNLYPKLYVKDVSEITEKILTKNNVKGLILDIDNTLIDYDKVMPDRFITWCENLKSKGIRMCIVSNTNKEYKVKKVAEILKLKYTFFAHKPNKKGLYKGAEMLKLPPESIATVGDQIFTDVWGGNRCKMFTILTEPIDKRDIFITKLKRPLERLVINMYLKTREKNEGEEKNVL